MSVVLSLIVVLLTRGVAVSRAALPSNPQLLALEATLCGEVALRNDSEYEEGNKLQNPYYDDVSSLAIIYCECEDDVVNAINFISGYQQEFDADLMFRVRSGGHSFGGYSKCEDCIIVDTSRLDSVTFDEEDNTITAGPGVMMLDLVDKFAEFNAIIPSGSFPNVALGGYALNGGLPVVVRSLGLLADYLVRARVVLADGRVLEVDKQSRSRSRSRGRRGRGRSSSDSDSDSYSDSYSDSDSDSDSDDGGNGESGCHHHELLYALRGGGLTVGIVTQYTFKAVSLEDNNVGLYSGSIDVVIDFSTFGDEARQVLKAYRDVAFVDSGEIYENTAFNPAMSVNLDLTTFTYVVSLSVVYYGTDYLTDGPDLVAQHFYDQIQERVDFTLPDLAVQSGEYVPYTAATVAAQSALYELGTAHTIPSRLLFDAHSALSDSFIDNFVDAYVTVAYPALSSYVVFVTISANWNNGVFTRESGGRRRGRLTSYFPNRDSDGQIETIVIGLKEAYPTSELVSGVLMPLLDDYGTLFDGLFDGLGSDQTYLGYANLFQTSYTNYFGRQDDSPDNEEIVDKIQRLKKRYDENDFFNHQTSIPVPNQ